VTIVGGISAALIFMFVLQRVWAPEVRRRHNDVLGPSVNVIGTTYAVLIAFMLSGVWNNLQNAQANAEQEANSLVNIWRITSDIDPSVGREVQDLCKKYARTVISLEWPNMQAGKPLPPETSEIINRLWKLAGQAQAHASPDSIANYQFMEELRMLTQYRRIRLMHSHEQLPGILRAVLIAGGIITVAASCFFGVPNFRFHVLQVIVLTFLISLVLIAIANIDRPYQGNDVVQPTGFVFALRTFQNQGD